MPFRTMSTLESWLDEFRTLGYPLSSDVRVIPQDHEHGVDTGLVTVALAHAPTAIYIAPEGPGSTSWHVTFEPRDVPAPLDAAAVMRLSHELAALSALCAFLETKSEAFIRTLRTSQPSASGLNGQGSARTR